MVSTRVLLSGATPLRRRLSPVVWGLLVAAAAAGAARAQPPTQAPPPPGGPVAELQALLREEAAPDLDARQAKIKGLIAQMDLGELSRVLLLEDWRTLETQANDVLKSKVDLARIQGDLQARGDAVGRFLAKAKEAMTAARNPTTGTPEERAAQMLGKAATADLIGETVVSARKLAYLSQLSGPGAQTSQISYLDQQLSGIPPDPGVTPDLIYLLTEFKDPDPVALTLLRRSAARALGEIHRAKRPQVAEVVHALDTLLADKNNVPKLRVTAAQSIEELSQAVSEEMQRSLGRDEQLRDCYLAFAQAVPAVLVHGLSADQPPEVRETCIRAFARIAAEFLDISVIPKTNEPPLVLDPKEIPAYKDKQKEYFQRIKDVFVDFQKNSAPLADAVVDDDPEVSRTALSILVDLGNARDRLQMLAAEPSPDASPKQEQQQAYEDLSQSLDATVKSLKERLRGTDVPSQRRALDVLEILGPTAFSVVDDVIASLHDPDRFVRWSAARTLGKLAQGETDKKKFTPKQVDDAVSGIADLLRDEDVGVRLAAVTALQRFGPRASPAAPILTRMLNRSQTDASLAIGPTTYHLLVKEPRTGSQTTPAGALLTPDTDQDLLKGDPVVRVNAFRALEAIDGEETVRALSEAQIALKDQNALVRGGAADFIGQVGPKAAESERRELIQALGQVLSDSEGDVRRAASSALVRLTRADKPK